MAGDAEHSSRAWLFGILTVGQQCELDSGKRASRGACEEQNDQARAGVAYSSSMRRYRALYNKYGDTRRVPW